MSQGIRECDGGESIAVPEHGVPNASQCIRECDGGETCALCERITQNFVNVLGSVTDVSALQFRNAHSSI